MAVPTPLAVVILAAGQGTRMRSALPKVLHAVAGRPILGHMLAAVRAIAAERIVVVTGKAQPQVAEFAAAAGALTAIQDPPLGTGHAAAAAKPALADFAGDVLVLYGDTPLLEAGTLAALRAGKGPGTALALMGFRPEDPGPYGRLVTATDGALLRIVEAKDASAEERAIGLCNAGGFLLQAALLWDLLGALSNANAQGEYYLTDIVAGARTRALRCLAVEVPAEDVQGVNTRAELAEVEAVMQRRLRQRAMLAGATLADPETVYLSADTVLGRDVTIGQNVVFAPGVTIADNVTIRPFCHLEGVTVDEGAIIGPFARLRPGSRIGRNVHIGNFVETKNADLGEGAKANHLTYLGDATVGAGANIGAGTITCNYDGFDKYRTEIGANAFIGSNAALVAPVTVGPGAYVGAGSVITKTVPADGLGLERSEQRALPGWAERFRARKRAERAAKVAAKKE